MNQKKLFVNYLFKVTFYLERRLGGMMEIKVFTDTNDEKAAIQKAAKLVQVDHYIHAKAELLPHLDPLAR